MNPDPIPADELETTEGVATSPEVSDPPFILVATLFVPVFAVVLWFMVRVFSGRWITDPATPPVPVPRDPDAGGVDGAPRDG